MDKAAIAAEYLAQSKLIYEGLEHRPIRKALIVGSNGVDNIGAKIAECLALENFETSHFDVDADGYSIALSAASVRYGQYDTLVLANGSTNMAWVEDQDAYSIERVIHDSMTASIIATRDFVEATIEAPYLKYIVYIGSMAYKSVLNASAPYCAAKAGLNHFAKCAAWELTPKGYRVFCVNPSNTEGTPMTEETIKGIMKYRGIIRKEAEDYWGAINLMPRWLAPEDIGEIVTLLVTDPAMEYLGGSSIDLAAGQR